jgi:hypothetical protein
MSERILYEVVIVDKKTNKILVNETVIGNSEVDAVLKAVSGKTIEQDKCDTIILKKAVLPKGPEKVIVEKE